MSIVYGSKMMAEKRAPKTGEKMSMGFAIVMVLVALTKRLTRQIHGNSAVRISLSNAHWHCHFTFHSLYYLISLLISSSSIVLVVVVVVVAIQPFALAKLFCKCCNSTPARKTVSSFSQNGFSYVILILVRFGSVLFFSSLVR